MKLFEDLNAAIAVLEEYATNSPDATPLQEVDIVYQGSHPKWLRLANSLKLRMAMRVVYAIPDQARAWAEEAVTSGRSSRPTAAPRWDLRRSFRSSTRWRRSGTPTPTRAWAPRWMPT